jgi:hypothetical protein
MTDTPPRARVWQEKPWDWALERIAVRVKGNQ